MLDGKEIAIVDADDWLGVYLDGKLVEEGHRSAFELADGLKLLGIKHKKIFADGDWLDDRGGLLPENLSEVKEEEDGQVVDAETLELHREMMIEKNRELKAALTPDPEVQKWISNQKRLP